MTILRYKAGIRREDKNRWEARIPLTPRDAAGLIKRHPLDFAVQPSPIRVFKDEEYRRAGIEVKESLADCPAVFAVKEIPKEFFLEGRAYMFFSHTTKGQSYNMAMLRRLMELKCHLIDYEGVTDEKGRRLIFFGRHAGLAGMVDTLWALGRRLAWEGVEPNPFAALRPAHSYPSLAAVKEAIHRTAGAAIVRGELPAELCPMVFGFAGYGHVSQGAQEILDLLPVVEVEPGDLPSLAARGAPSRSRVYKTVFREEHMVSPASPGGVFDLEDYYRRPERYRPAFNEHLPWLTVLMNCIFWTEKYPRLVTREEIAELFASAAPRLRVVGDISCDVEGAVEFLVKTTESDNPVFVYEPATGEAVDGVAGRGPVVLAVDNLPCELPLESSEHFSRSLAPFVFPVVSADYTVPFDRLDLPEAVKKALILHRGELTPRYAYMEKYIA